MKTVKRICILLTSVMLISSVSAFIFPASADAFYTSDINCTSAILMEAATGKVLYEKNADVSLPPASVTKIMTLLLAMEALDAGKITLTEKVTASERAASMGGSQVYLKVGEQLTVEEMLKCVIICSANDACVALAEHISGSVESFVENMNRHAKELGMNNTNFENTNGLDDTAKNHITSARDIALMSKELLKHEIILEYSGIWQDSIRDGAFILTNTNRLIRFYNGANGLKTGSTSKAGFCISATAKRDNMQLICVVMGAPTRDVRNEIARSLLDFGFANYSLFSYEGALGEYGKINVTGGMETTASLSAEPFYQVIEKGKTSSVKTDFEIPAFLPAPIAKGDTVGKAIFTLGDRVIGESKVTSDVDIPKITFGVFYKELLHCFLMPITPISH